MGYLLLEGGAEFGGSMREPDARAIELAGGFAQPVRILPTAAAPDNNHQRAGSNGVRWFQSLGAKDVLSIPVVDRASADDPEIVESLRDAKLIYMLGGFTHYLAQTLQNSLVWNAVLDAWHNGAVIAGSSAGAMALCEFYYDPGQGRVHNGLNLIPNAIVLPHHNSFGKSWAPRLLPRLPNITLIGIDEQTGMINDGPELWTVYGRGSVTLYKDSKIETIRPGKTFSLSPGNPVR